METKNLKLLTHSLSNITFKINDSFDWSNESLIDMHPNFERRIKKIDDDHASIEIEFKTSVSAELPFYLNVTIVGVFECENWDKDKIGRTIISDNATCVIFPYLRHAISEITMMSGLPSYVLPIMNIHDLFEQQ